MHRIFSRLGLLVVALAVCAVWSIPAVVSADDAEQEKEVTLKQVPKKVKATILKAAGKNDIKEVEEVVLKLYEAEWIQGKKEVEIFVTPQGKLLMKKVEKADDDEEEGKEDKDGEEDDGEVKEKKVSIDEIPAQAKATILKLAKKNEVLEVEEVHLKFYEAEWIQGKQEIEILVAYDGTLVKREKEKAGDDDEDDNEDHDK